MSFAGEQYLESKLQILFDATATLIGSFGAEELLPKVLELARKLNSAGACALWRQDPDTGAWRIASAVGLSSAYRDITIASDANRPIGDQPLCFEDVAESPQTAPRRELYQAEGIRSVMAMPMNIGGSVSATLAFYYREPRRFSETELRVAGALTCLAASAIDTAELHREQQRRRAEEEQARVRAAFLAEASAVLASSLDYEVTLAAVARLAVPHIADWCVVDMGQPDGSLARLAVGHVDPEKVAWALEVSRKHPADLHAAGGVGAVFRTSRSELCENVTDEMLVRYTQDAEHLELLRGLGFTSYMCVPLALRRRVLGAITFVSATQGRRYGPADLALAEDLAHRAAMAIENATLYADAQRERAALETALAALRENEERLVLAMRAGRLGIWDWDLRSGALKWSDNTAGLFGLMPKDLPRTLNTFLRAVHPDDRAGFRASTDRAVQQKTYFECEFRVLPAGRGVRWLAAKGKVFCDAAGEPVRMIGIGMDITGRRLLEEKLRNAQKLESIGLLAGGIAHDFNNLLTGILGNASLAMELLPPGEEAGMLLDNVVQASERAADLTQQLLAYSGKGRVIVEPLDLSSLVHQITHLLQATLPKLVTLKLELASGLPAVEADSSQVQQVVMNLVINAAEAIADSPGTVTIRTALRRIDDRHIREDRLSEDLPPGSYVCLEVRDTGSGMDTATLSRIFDPFFTTKFTGRGLGLAAVSGILRSHRGAIRASSEVGHGSVFEVLFPATATTVPVIERPDDAEDLTGSGLILVIDDEAAVRSAAGAALRRYGYRVEIANDGAAGVEAFRRHPGDFAAVLLDLTMPVMGGEKALAMIKAIRPQAPVVASSGYSEAEASRRFPPGAVDAFLQKPYSAATLARKMKSVIPRAVVQGGNNA